MDLYGFRLDHITVWEINEIYESNKGGTNIYMYNYDLRFIHCDGLLERFTIYSLRWSVELSTLKKTAIAELE